MTGISAVIHLARLMLAFINLIIVIGFLWSGGNMPKVEIFIWVILFLISAYGIYVGRGSNLYKNPKDDRLFFIMCALAIFIALVLNIVGLIVSPHLKFLFFFAIPFLLIFLLKRVQWSRE